MASEKTVKLILIVSLAFAALVVFGSLILPSDDTMQAITFVLITFWLIPFGYLLKLRKNATKKTLANEKEEHL